MTDLRRTTQTGSGPFNTGQSPSQGEGESNEGADFGTSERATRGTDRDADSTGESKNQGHGHPREERGSR
ncbi:MAG TPA: hypothetical protein VHG28_19860 [Longimicrobiaceae bacterium]|nr:hypothetical protein [Longimicrobiaceae bacterium]